MADSKNPNLKWAKDHFSTYAPQYSLFKDYYYGRHIIRLSDQTKKSFEMLLGNIRDNLCPCVCDSLTDRLVLTGFTCEDQVVSEQLNLWWDELKMDSRAATVHKRATMKGDCYVIVWPDENDLRVPRIYPQKSQNIAVRYEDNGQEEVIVEAVKAWVSTDGEGNPILRVTRYLPDRVERYYAESTVPGIPDSTEGLTPFVEEGQEPVFPNPWGRVMVFRFANSLDPDVYAHSELTDVVPHQDIINKALCDMMVGEEFHGLPIRWAAGLTCPIDRDTGKPMQPFKVAGDRMWTVGDQEVKFGQFDAADLRQFLNVLDNERHEIARVTRTPLHLMLLNTGDFPSGEALRTAEAPIISKAKKRQQFWGEVWVEVMQACADIAGLNVTGKIEPQWADPSPASETEKLSALGQKKSLGVSQAQLLKEAGYEDDKIAEMLAANEEAAVKNAERAAASFNAGRGV